MQRPNGGVPGKKLAKSRIHHYYSLSDENVKCLLERCYSVGYCSDIVAVDFAIMNTYR